MAAPELSSFDLALREQIKNSEARLEKLSSFMMIGAVLACYLLFMLAVPNPSQQLRREISLLVAVAVTLFGLSAMLIHYFRFVECIKWTNTFLQVSLVSAAIFIDNRASGPVFALTSAPPFFYPFIISLTAFRLQPSLTVFAAVTAVGEYMALYFWLLYPAMPEVSRSQISPLGVPITIMKMVLFLGVGLACAIAAGYLRRLIKTKVEQEVRNADLQRMFGRYVSPEIALSIIESGDALKPRLVDAVIMFGDLRGFTHFSEGKDPQIVANLLNEYFEVVCRVVESEGRIVNKFMGDGFLAFFGVLLKQEAPAEAGAQAALRLEEELRPLLGPMGLTMGVALHSGKVIAGEIGSIGRCEFTVIGETVNIASRLEGLNRPLGTSRLTSAEVARAVEEGYSLKSRGLHELKGVEAPFAVFELLAAYGKSRPQADLKGSLEKGPKSG